MRLDARCGGYHDWRVIDTRTGLKRLDVVWVDDQTHELGRFRSAFEFWDLVTERASKIVILPERKTILLNVREDLIAEDQRSKTEQPVAA